MKAERIGILEEEAFRHTLIPGITCVELSAPLAVQYEINGGCNQRCLFCYNVWKGTENKLATLPPQKRRAVVERIIELEVFEVILSGGEPLLIPELCELIKRIAQENIKIYLITNGSFLTASLAGRLKSSGLNSLQISLHGSNSKLHDFIVRKQGSFERTISGIENAIKVFTPDAVNVNMVLVDQNHKDVETLMRFLAKMGISHFSLGFLSKAGAALSKEAGIRKGQILEAFYSLTRTGQETGLDVGISGGFPMCLFPEVERDRIIELSANLCDAGLNQIVISPLGEIRACVCLPQVLGNILTDDPAVVWKKSIFLQSLQRLEHVPTECYDCDVVSMCKGGCRAAAYWVYGDFKKIDPVLEA